MSRRRPAGRLLGAMGVGVLLLMAGLATPASAAVKVFFPRGEQVVAVPRPGSTAEDAVRALLRGPTPAERKLGFRTYIPKGTSLRSVTVAGGRATVDLGPKIMQGTNGEGLNARLVQLVYTATGTPGVRSAQVFIAGGTVLGVFPGIDASIPLTRESLATPSAPVPAPVGPSTGASTPEVAALQTRLAALGFLPADAVDGRLGPRTTAGVIAFQKWARLGRDGQAGPAHVDRRPARHAALRAGLIHRRRPGHDHHPAGPGAAPAGKRHRAHPRPAERALRGGGLRRAEPGHPPDPGAQPLRAARGVIRTGESYGAVFAKGSRLRGPVNRALAALKKDGTIAALQRRWLTADLSRLPVLR